MGFLPRMSVTMGRTAPGLVQLAQRSVIGRDIATDVNSSPRFGDPGPSTSAHRKSQRQRLLERIRSGSNDPADLPLTPAEMQALLMAPRGRDRPKADRALGSGDSGRDETIAGPRSSIVEYASRSRGSDESRRGDFQARRPNLSQESRGFRSSRDGVQPQRNGQRGSVGGRMGQSARSAPSDAYQTSQALQRYIASCSSPMTRKELENAISMVHSSPKEGVSVVTWNILLGMLGRQGHTAEMWSQWNTMKKYGHKPTCRTFIAMFNGFSNVPNADGLITRQSAHMPNVKIRSQASIVWHQARMYLDSITPKQKPASLGLAITSSSKWDDEDEGKSSSGESVKVRCGTINAYLKYLAKYGMWRESVEVWKCSVNRGEPFDLIGYTTLLQAMLFAARKQTAWKIEADRMAHVQKVDESRLQAANREIPLVEVCQNAREMWNLALEHLGGKNTNSGGIDNTLACTAVQVLLMGRTNDQKYAIHLMEKIWDLPPLRSGSLTATTQESMETDARLPKLKADMRVATILVHALDNQSRPSLAAHYARFFLSHPILSKRVDHHFLHAAATAFANTNDFESTESLLRTYAMPDGGWRLYFWYDCLSAARWAGNWDGLKWVLSLMEQLPQKVSTRLTSGPVAQVGNSEESAVRARSNDFRDIGQLGEGKRRDITRRLWVKQTPVDLDVKAATIVLKAALSRSKEAAKEALMILDHRGFENLLPGCNAANWTELEHYQSCNQAGTMDSASSRSKKESEWRSELAKEINRGVNWILEGRLASEPESAESQTWTRVERMMENYLSHVGQQQRQMASTERPAQAGDRASQRDTSFDEFEDGATEAEREGVDYDDDGSSQSNNRRVGEDFSYQNRPSSFSGRNDRYGSDVSRRASTSSQREIFTAEPFDTAGRSQSEFGSGGSSGHIGRRTGLAASWRR